MVKKLFRVENCIPLPKKGKLLTRTRFFILFRRVHSSIEQGSIALDHLGFTSSLFQLHSLMRTSFFYFLSLPVFTIPQRPKRKHYILQVAHASELPKEYFLDKGVIILHYIYYNKKNARAGIK